MILGTLSWMGSQVNLAERVHRGRKAIALARQKGLDTADWETTLAALLSAAGTEPGPEDGFEPWMLWEWRRVSTPDWRRILQESIRQDDADRESYARWMLSEVLLDPQYEDTDQ